MAARDLSQCLLWFNPEGLVVDANPNAQALFQRDLRAMQALNHATLVGEDHPESRHYQAHWGRIRDGLIRNEERSFRDAQGNEIWTSVSYAAIRNGSGRTRRILAIVIDLSPWSWRPKD